MTDQSAFEQPVTPPATPETTPPTSTDAFANQLSTIKNENGEQKYDSVEKALEALNHSQAFIPQLKADGEVKDAEIAQLKEQLAGSAAIEDVVARLTAQQEPTIETPPQTSGLDEQAVLKLVQNFATQKQEADTAKANEVKVSNALVAQYGDKTSEVLEQKAQEVGTTVEKLKALAQESPEVVMQLFQVKAAPTPSPTTSSVTIPARDPSQEGLQPPSKSLLRGATTKEQVEYLRKIREDVYKKHNVEV